jgi:hypothetical protein
MTGIAWTDETPAALNDIRREGVWVSVRADRRILLLAHRPFGRFASEARSDPESWW